MKMETAIERLMERLGDARPERPGAKGRAVLAVVIVDRQGRLVQSPAIAISSFGWGVMTALNGSLTDLARRPQVETEAIRRLEMRLLGLVSDGEDEKEEREAH